MSYTKLSFKVLYGPKSTLIKIVDKKIKWNRLAEWFIKQGLPVPTPYKSLDGTPSYRLPGLFLTNEQRNDFYIYGHARHDIEYIPRENIERKKKKQTAKMPPFIWGFTGNLISGPIEWNKISKGLNNNYN